MKEKDYRFIQDQIDYRFSNLDLLRQAFVRSSYSNENGGQNNEVLEFIGDKVLDYIVVKYLTVKFGSMTEDAEWNVYKCQYSEHRLTEMKKALVQKSNLADRICALGFEQYLIMGKSDRMKNIQNEESVQEDLFEAILGAIAIDSNWNMQVLQDAVEIMLNPDDYFEDEENYVELIQEWALEDGNSVPWYCFEEERDFLTNRNGVFVVSYITGSSVKKEQTPTMYRCLLKLNDSLPIFTGHGRSKNLARKDVSKIAYNYLDDNGLLFTIRDEIDEPSKEMAINQLEILARRGYFSLPIYEFQEKYDNNGNPFWKSKCIIDGEKNFFIGKAPSKKEAKKKAAYGMLMYVLENY